jgi:hypothetical protein
MGVFGVAIAVIYPSGATALYNSSTRVPVNDLLQSSVVNRFVQMSGVALLPTSLVVRYRSRSGFVPSTAGSISGPIAGYRGRKLAMTSSIERDSCDVKSRMPSCTVNV